MKKTVFTISACIIVILLNGCLTTLHPLFTTKDLIADNRLVGKWKKSKDGSVITYQKALHKDLLRFSEGIQLNADKIYMATVKDSIGNLESVYYAFLVKLGKNYYMDYYPAATREKENSDAFFKAHYIPMHSIYRIDFSTNGTFEMKQLDGNYLEKLIQNKQVRIKHEVMSDGSLLITAPTEELQQYVAKYGDVPEAYENDNAAVYTKINE